MRTRLLAIVLSLVGLLLVSLGMPLAFSVAEQEQQKTFLDRLADTNRFASLAQQAITEDRPELMAGDLSRYEQVYGSPAAVIDTERQVLVSSGTRMNLGDPEIKPLLNEALAGREPQLGPLLVPWDTRPLVIAEPVLADGELRGVTVTVSSTAAARARILRWWIALAAGGLLALGFAVLLALPVVRWILRPVRRLDTAAASLAAAVVSGNEVQPVGADAGPPELRRLSSSFDRMAASVAEVLAAQRSFVADASHQLRNPLTALRLRLGNLAEHVHGEGVIEQKESMAEADRLSRIADDLLTMARADTGSGEPLEIDVDAVVTARLAAWQVAANARGVDLVLGGERGGRALALPRGMETVLDALLDNAVKFSHEGDAIEVDVRRAGGWVRVAVRDHGPGLRPDELERATDRFWRAPAHQNVAGSGLGLAIVRRIVEAAGGTVTLDLPGGGGLRIVVVLPAVEATAWRPDRS